SAVEPRRQIVAQANCGGCHGTFSKDFSVHGGLRNQVEYCAICHNPKNTDGAQRKTKTGVGANPTTETIAFRHMIHKIHRGEDLENRPYVTYGFNGNATNSADLLFPGDPRDCAKCHTTDSQLLPLTPGHVPTNLSVISGGVEAVTGTRPPIQDVCLACHD